MNGQLGTGVIEGTTSTHRHSHSPFALTLTTLTTLGIWRKLKGVAPVKRTFTMFVNTVIRVACDLSDHQPVNRDRLDKGLEDLIRQQTVPKGKRLDEATYEILRRCYQKLTYHITSENI